MKKILCLFLCFLGLMVSCSKESNTALSQTQSILQDMADNGDTANEFLDVKYEISDRTGANEAEWIDEGRLLAVASGGEINYIDTFNNAVGSAHIDKGFLPNSHRLIYGMDKIFILHQSGMDGFYTTAFSQDGRWQLYNGSIHKRDGTVLKEYLALDQFYDTEKGQRFISNGEDVTQNAEENLFVINTVKWLDNNNLVLAANRALFFYNVASDTLTLVDDFSAELPPAVKGTDGGFYRINQIVPFNNGCLYSVHDVEGQFNLKSHIYFTDGKTSRQPAFGGKIFSRGEGTKDAFLAIGYVNNAQGDVEYTRISIATPKLSEYAMPDDFEGSLFLWNIYKLENITRFAFCGQDVFYVVDVNGTQVTQSEYKPDVDGFQFELLSVSGEPGALEYKFSARHENEERYASYAYNEKTNELRKLSKYYNPFNGLKSADDVYLNCTPDFYDPRFVQVVPFL